MKNLLDIIGVWALISVIAIGIAVGIWGIYELISEETRTTHTPKNYTQSWTVTDPQGQTWKIVKD